MNTILIWDYDGTLVDTRFKNLNVNRRIIETVTGRQYHDFPALRSISNYDLAQKKMTNWQDLYRDNFDLNESEVIKAGNLWSKFSQADETETPVYFGIKQVLNKLHNFKQGIFSQNSKAQIEKTLTDFGLLKYFSAIIGYEELGNDEQKPSPNGLLRIMDDLGIERNGTLYFIGDHSTDFKCAINANNFLSERDILIKAKSIGVNYTPDSQKDAWDVQPDFVANTTDDIVKIVKRSV